jgi:adenylosuccinate synthase
MKIEPVYQRFAGWNKPSSAAKSASELPDAMKSYVDFINEYLGVKVHYISNGPGRDQLIQIQ